MLDPARRLMLLASLGDAQRNAWCAPADVAALSLPEPVPGLRALADGPDSASEPFALAVMQLAAAALGPEPGPARLRLAALLDGWAGADALARSKPGHANTYYALDRTLLPTLVGYALIRDEPALEPARRVRIDRWLERLVRWRGIDRPDPTPGNDTARNNHAYLRASVDMAWGALMDDAEAYRRGPEALEMALADMRPDGSLPLETKRGARALWYQRHAIASLVAIAEMAAVHGQDLYGRRVGGRDLHRAIAFLLDGIDDPRKVWPYAALDHNPRVDADHREQDLGFLEPRRHGRHYMAWTEPYMARFPDRPEARRLAALLRAGDSDPRPLVDDYSGGNATCFFADPGGLRVALAP